MYLFVDLKISVNTCILTSKGFEMSDYSKLEENINVYSHVFGILLGFVGLTLLVIKSLGDYNTQSVVSFYVFGLSIITLFTASANYHRTIETKLRLRRKVLDHSAIYVLIAGTYTPFALAAIGGVSGWIIFGVSWTLALIGISLKVFFTGRFKKTSTLMYVLMGWMIVFFIKPLTLIISNEGFLWLLVGGVLYTIGAVTYSIKKIPLNHAIFHFFVLAGSICHFVSIYSYV